MRMCGRHTVHEGCIDNEKQEPENSNEVGFVGREDLREENKISEGDDGKVVSNHDCENKNFELDAHG